MDTAAYLKSKKSVHQLLLFGFAKWLHLPQPDGVSIEVIEALCPRVDDSEKGQRVLCNLLADAKVVLCTLNTAGSTFLRRALGGRFNTLFLDEAAQVSSTLLYVLLYLSMNMPTHHLLSIRFDKQCPEVEFYIATTFPGITRIVLIGDPMQLNATCISYDLLDMGYGKLDLILIWRTHHTCSLLS